ncbi:unnamed protein product [Amaranthus hypochondriacus]
MQTKNHLILSSLLILVLLAPSNIVAQDSFKGNAGDVFTPSTIIIIIMGIIFMFTGCLAVFLRQFSDGCFGLNVAPPNPNLTSDGQLITHGLDPESIKSLPTYLYSDVKQHRKGQVDLNCPVCLSEFQDEEVLRLLPVCSHVFHPRCIDLWLTKHVTCPICRQSLVPESGVTKPHSIIHVPPQGDQTQPSDHHDCHQDSDNGEMVDDVKKVIVGKFPRSHSTGHSMGDNSDRFTLVLPEEVQNRLPDRSKTLSSILSPRSANRCGWFSVTPPIININIRSNSGSTGSMVNSSKSSTRGPVKTTDRLWPI